jgi:uncharacterized protein YndB with AHSA1/START domain
MSSGNKTQVIAEAGRQELFVIREFEAEREEVYKAFSDPDILIQFFAPSGASMTYSARDFRTGGHYRYSHKDTRGNVICTFKGVFHEMRAPELIIQTAELEGFPGLENALLESMIFEELPGNRCRLTIHDICFSVDTRDAMLQSGMESGLVMIFNQLDELLKNK